MPIAFYGFTYYKTTLVKFIEKWQKVNEYFQLDAFDSSRLYNLRDGIRCFSGGTSN